MKKSQTVLIPMKDIIKEELGKSGLEEMQKQRNVIQKQNDQFQKKNASSKATPIQ